MKISLKLLARLIVIAMLIVLSACSGNTQSTSQTETSTVKKYTIAVIPKALNNAVFLDTKTGAEKAGKELGIKILWTGPEKSEAVEQIKVIEDIITNKKADAILVSCNDASELDSVIKKAYDAGIKVATFDSDAPQSVRLFYAGSDNYKLGFRCGEEMKVLIKGKGKIKVAMLTGVKGAFNLDERIRGFKEGSAGADIEYGDIYECKDDVEQAQKLMEENTKKDPTIKAWYAAGAWPFLNKPEKFPVIREFAKDGGIVITVDAFYPMLQFVKEGTVQALAGQNFVAMGELGVRELYKAIKGESIKRTFLDTTLVFVNKENVDEMLKTSTPWN